MSSICLVDVHLETSLLYRLDTMHTETNSLLAELTFGRPVLTGTFYIGLPMHVDDHILKTTFNV